MNKTPPAAAAFPLMREFLMIATLSSSLIIPPFPPAQQFKTSESSIVIVAIWCTPKHPPVEETRFSRKIVRKKLAITPLEKIVLFEPLVTTCPLLR